MATGGAADIRKLAGDDLSSAIRLSTSAGWNQRLDDWRLLHALSAGRGFAAVMDGSVVGTAVTIDYGTFAWVAMMLVDPAYRGRGLGKRLLEAAIDAVAPDRPVRLDATPAGRALYLAYGFEDETTLTRSVAPAARAAAPAPADAPVVRSLRVADLPAVLRHDIVVFGANREAVLRWSLDQAPAYARTIDGAEGPPQYSFGRPGRLYEQIGPVVASDDRAAAAMVEAGLAAAVGRAVVLDTFDIRFTFAAWLRSSGFIGERPLFRMCRRSGHQAARDRPAMTPSEFTIFGPDLG